MLCRDCLEKICNNLSKEAKRILDVLPGTKNDAMHKAGLSYAVTTRAFIELESTLLVSYEDVGRSKVYALTDNGKQIKNGPAKEPIRWKDF